MLSPNPPQEPREVSRPRETPEDMQQRITYLEALVEELRYDLALAQAQAQEPS